jgi:hypothetical protein
MDLKGVRPLCLEAFAEIVSVEECLEVLAELSQ